MAPPLSLGLLQLLLVTMSTMFSPGQAQGCYRTICPNNTVWCHRFYLASPVCNTPPAACEFLNLTTQQILRNNLNQLILPSDGSFWTGAFSQSSPNPISPGACWSQNLSFPASISVSSATDVSGKIVTAVKGTSGVTYAFSDLTASRKAICEIPSAYASSVDNELCYTEIGKCFFVSSGSNTVNTYVSGSGCGVTTAKLATATTAAEDMQLRDFINYLPMSADAYYVNATPCSQPYIFNKTNEVLDMVEYWNFATPVTRSLSQYGCAMVGPNGLSWQQCPSNPTNYICYQGTSPALSDEMCQGSYCHVFWPMSLGVGYDIAKQKCNGSMPSRAGLVELLKEGPLLPSRVVNSTSTKYYAGVKKVATGNRTFKWNKGTSYTDFTATLPLPTGSESFHCVIATKTADVVNYAAQDCTIAQNTIVVCNGSTTAAEAAASRTFQGAVARCKQSSTDLASTDVNITLSNGQAAWLNVFEYQPWQWPDGQLIYASPSPEAATLAPQLLQAREVLYNQDQCAFVRVSSVNNNATLSLEVGQNCTEQASVACQFNSTTCSGVPSYELGYISGTVANNLSDSSFSVDVLNGSCPLDLTSPFFTQSAVFFTCNSYNTTFLGNDTTMIQSQCSLSSSGPAWTPLMNSDLCQSKFCDSRKIIDYAYPQNVQYLNITADDNSTVNINRSSVDDGTKLTLTCRPGAMITKADDNFEPGGAISNEITCQQSTWNYSVATFANSTTIQVCDKLTSGNKLLKCEPIKCNTSDFKFLPSVNDRIPRTYMLQNENLTVNCSTNTSASFNLNPKVNIQCVLVGDYTYGYVVTNTFNGVSFSRVWNNSNTTLDDTIGAVCRSAEYPPCSRNQSWLDQSGLEIVSMQSTWPGYTASSLFFPPNATVTVRCSEPRVSDRFWNNIGQTSTMRCAVDKANPWLQWNDSSLSLGCSYSTCPSADSLLPPFSMATGLKTNLSDTWVSYYNASKYPPASQILVNCSADVTIFQILYCNDSGQWVPVQYSYVNDSLDLCIGSYINCSMMTTSTTQIPTTTTPIPTTTLVVETTTSTPTSTTVDTTRVTTGSTTVTVEMSSTTTYSTHASLKSMR